MNKLLFLLLFLIPVLIDAQEVEVSKFRLGITGGWATFNQSDLIAINRETINNLPFDSKIIDEFEPNFNFGAYTQYRLFHRFWLGTEYHYYYTGSRLGQKDYSGVYSFDQYLKAHAVGLKFDFLAAEINSLSLYYQLNAGGIITEWKMDYELNLSEAVESEISKLKGLSWYAHPAIAVEFKVFQNFSVNGSVGYLFDVLKDYQYKANSEFKVVRKPDWSGLRLSLGVEYEF